METDDTEKKFVLSRKPDFCEECRQWKPVIIRDKKRYLLSERFFRRGK